MVSGQLEFQMQKNGFGPLSHTTRKNELKTDQRPKQWKSLWPRFSNVFCLFAFLFLFDMAPESTSNQRKNEDVQET